MALACPVPFPRHPGHTRMEHRQQHATDAHHKFQNRRLAAIARGKRFNTFRSLPHAPLSPFALDEPSDSPERVGSPVIRNPT